MPKRASASKTTDDPAVMRERILEAALAHVPFDGWTIAALTAGATDAGLDPAMVHEAFPGGVLDAIEHHSRLADERMLKALEGQDLSSMRTRDKVALAIRLRLEHALKDREAIRRALTVLAIPFNAGVGLAALYRTVDAIWYAAGDTATDFNFYTKRGLLAGVYSATLLYWLEDKSEGHEATWQFLSRRIEDALRVPQALAQVQKLFQGFAGPFGQPWRGGRAKD
ncbi:MAG: COQ9 family protein [Alphaproteobacteria bacterium]